MPRFFTPAEANAALAELRPVAERMVAHRRALSEAQLRQSELVARITGNGGDIPPTEVRAAADDVLREAEALAECVRLIDEAGVQVKDLDEGLLDFPARRDGEEVLLCWKLGEPEVVYWHGLDEGFAGRKPLPF
jgi:hypothetical protein